MLKRALRWMGRGLLALSVLFTGSILYVQLSGIPKYPLPPLELKVEVTPERVERGRKFAHLLCANCHLDSATQRLTGKRMLDAPPEFGVVISKNITRHPTRGIGSWTDGELAYLLRTGVRRDGQYLPPYMPKLPHLADEDLHAIIAFLRSSDPMVAPSEADPGVTRPSFLTKLLTHGPFQPLPYPSRPVAAPASEDAVAYGRYLVVGLDCYGCHSADFKTMNAEEPEKTPGFLGGGNTLYNLRGEPILSANLTPDATGIGRWSEAEFVRALKLGIRPDGKPLRYPMTPMSDLTDAEAVAIFAYLRRTPPIQNAVPRMEEALASADRGKRLYFQYACVSCHGEDGQGIADLREASVRYPSDAELISWIRNAPAKRPGVRMPVWEGVIAEDEYPALAAYVRKLGAGQLPKDR